MKTKSVSQVLLGPTIPFFASEGLTLYLNGNDTHDSSTLQMCNVQSTTHDPALSFHTKSEFNAEPKTEFIK